MRLLSWLVALTLPTIAIAQADPHDWPMYNRDILGTRHNPAEKTLSPKNMGSLQEKWRYPASGSKLEIGVIHATPIVVAGSVYFGTASDTAFYKLKPDGTLAWSYRNPIYSVAKQSPEEKSEAYRNRRFASAPNGILASALVHDNTVYFVDIGGWIYALDTETGKERWTVNTRAKEFPGNHPINSLFASPMMLEGKLIVAGGTLEQVVAAFPGYQAASGRGFVMALDPSSGKLLWKYDLGPKPEKLDPPIVIKDTWGEHKFYFGPATSSIWSTPGYDAASGTLFVGTDVNTAPRRPTADNPRLETPDSCAVLALDVHTGQKKWSTQLNPGDVWTNAMRSYDPKSKLYKDQSIGDTPKPYTINLDGKPTKVVGVGCKNGGFYVLNASDGAIIAHTPLFQGPPSYPLSPKPDKRMLALPSPIGGLQTGCATDGKYIYTNGIDALLLGSQAVQFLSGTPPTGGRVVALSLDTSTELWRHERPKVASIGGPPHGMMYKNVGDPVASGIAVANGVVYFTTITSGKLVALDAASGNVLKEIDLGPVWSGPAVSRGHVYIGTGNTLFSPSDHETFFPKKKTGELRCFGLGQ